MLMISAPLDLSNKLTKGNLHLLQRLYRNVHVDYVVNTLSDVRVSTLFMDTSHLVEDEEDRQQGTKDCSDFDNGESKITHDIGRMEDDKTFRLELQHTGQPTFGNEKLDRTILVDVTIGRDNHRLSKIFDPQNKSLLLESCNRSPIQNETAIAESLTPLRMATREESANVSYLLKKKSFRPKSRIPKPKSFNIPPINCSKSKHDLKFPNLDI